MTESLQNRLIARATWIRALYMILFAVFAKLAALVIAAVVIVQFLFALFGGAPLARLSDFGSSLAAYLRELVAYLVYASETRPFPFGPWPALDVNAGVRPPAPPPPEFPITRDD